MAPARCDACGELVAVGDWPFCPHGQGAQTVIGDDVPGGFTVENGFDRPTTFYSKKAHRDALAAKGLTINAKYAGDGYEQHLTNWAAGMDAKTLDNARVLLERGSKRDADSERARLAAVSAEFPITVTTLRPEDVGR